MLRVAIIVWFAGVASVLAGVLLRWLYLRRGSARTLGRAFIPLASAAVLLPLSVAIQQWEPIQNTTFDVSTSRQTTLSAVTKKVLNSLDKETSKLTLTAFIPPLDPQWQHEVDLLQQFVQRSHGRVALRVVNPFQNPSVARSYGGPAVGTVFVEGNGSREPVTTVTEPQLTTAILRFENSKHVLCWVTGDGELGPDDLTLSFATSEMARYGFTFRAVNILTGGSKALESCTGAVLFSPSVKPLPAEATLWKNYINRPGVGVLFLLDPYSTSNTVADAWLAPTGARADARAVSDPEGSLAGDPKTLVSSRFPSGNPITEGLASVVLVGARSFHQPAEDTSTGLSVSTLVASTSEGLPLAVAADRSQLVGSGASAHIARERWVIVGSAGWLSSTQLQLSSNEALLVKSLQWLTDAPTLADIPVNFANSSILLVLPADLRRIDLGMFGLPILLLGCVGLFRVWRRRVVGRERRGLSPRSRRIDGRNP